MEELKKIIDAQEERLILENKINSIPYLHKNQLKVYQNLLELGFNYEGFRVDETNSVVIHLRREISVWLNAENTVFNGHFLEISNMSLERLSNKEMEEIVKSIKTMFNIVYKK